MMLGDKRVVKVKSITDMDIVVLKNYQNRLNHMQYMNREVKRLK